MDKCPGTLGDKPFWMSWDQYDPCSCVLEKDHEGDHVCKHGISEK